ncbi:MAG: glycosyltransferase family 4 protein [Vicinamibacteraceae bacterium]|nr:glycosyltransferase family 4 protein [Vicinamibacteraceae bacterium]
MTRRTATSARRLLFLTRYGRRAASTRFRFLQFFPYLEAEGFTCEVSPLLDDGYLDARLDRGRVDISAVARGYARRLRALRRIAEYDAVVLYMEALPFLPAFLERSLARRDVPVIYDFDDACFHKYDRHGSRLVRVTLGSKIGRVIGGASLVLAGNDYLAQYARRFTSSVEIVPTVVDTDRFAPARPARESGEVVVGWIGSPSTSAYLHDLCEVWPRVLERGRARLVLVGSGPIDLGSQVPVTVLPWREDEEISAIQSFDIGIMPLRDDPWSRGKCGFKLIEYMACGLPVVASPVGVNTRIVEPGGTGFLCENVDDWVGRLRALIDDRRLRTQLGGRARAVAEEHWSLQRWAPEVVRLVKEVVARRAAR